jgi:hypothetical protein
VIWLRPRHSSLIADLPARLVVLAVTALRIPNFNPTTAAGHWALNSAHSMVWPNQPVASNAGDFGTFLGGGGFSFMFTNVAGSAWQVAINDGTNDSTETTATGKGFYLVSRQNSSGKDYYWNNTVSGNRPQPSTSLVNSNIWIGGVNGNGAGLKQISAASVGGALSSTDAANFYSRLQAYMTAVGN